MEEISSLVKLGAGIGFCIGLAHVWARYLDPTGDAFVEHYWNKKIWKTANKHIGNIEYPSLKKLLKYHLDNPIEIYHNDPENKENERFNELYQKLTIIHGLEHSEIYQ
ncbi:hypothetical protein ACFL1H_03515 [Nanoarchaeota archaeon]